MKKQIYMFLFMMGIFIITVGNAFAEKVEIEYWQYSYKTRMDAVNKLIKQFEQDNPTIKVKHVTIPYASYRTKITAAIGSGQGPDLVQLYYGWLDDFLKAGLLQPLSEDIFDYQNLDDEFFDMVNIMKKEGRYYALPTAVRSLALFWNKDIFKEVGLDPERPPKTLEELREYAKKLAKYDKRGNIIRLGLSISMIGQGHHWWREVLVRQFGGIPYTDDYTRVTYQDKGGKEAIDYLSYFLRDDLTSKTSFTAEEAIGFTSGLQAMQIDGSFRLGTFDTARRLNYGVAELPEHNGIKSTFASYWVNGVTTKAKGAKAQAAMKFLRYLTSEEAMATWMDVVGELPARKSIALQDKYLNHPKYGPFIKGLSYAHATVFVNETEQRKITSQMLDRVILENVSSEETVQRAAQEEQRLIDNALQ